MTDKTVAQTGFSRVFLIENRARPDRSPSYESDLRMDGIDQSFGDRTDIENPDPLQYNKFVKVGKVKGQVSPVSTSLIGKYALDLRSKLLRLAKQGCDMDIQLHWGACEDPSDFNTFRKALILEDVDLTNYSTDPLGALSSDERAEINETGDISAREAYEVVRLSFAIRAAAAVTNEIVDGLICDILGCGDCEESSDGCQKAYFVSKAAGGSPGTPADVVYSVDGGANWFAHDVDTLDAADDPTGISCLGSFIVVVSNDSNSLHYATKSEFTAGSGDPEFTEVATGFVAGGEPNKIFVIGTKAFVVGDGGYIYSTEDPTTGVTVLDAGVATTSVLKDVYAISGDYAVAVGENGAVIFTTNGTVWGVASSFPVGAGVTLNTVFMKSSTEWHVGSDAGQMFVTYDAGVTWEEKTFNGSGSGSILDIEYATDSVGYMSHQTAATKARILRTYNGGNSWVVLPESSDTLPAMDAINSVAVCVNDPNFIIGGGLADDGADGVIIVGDAAGG